MRLAMVAARYFPLNGGIETHVDEVARRLVHRGVDVTILTTDVSGQLSAVEERHGATVRRYRAYPRSRDYYFSPSLIRHLVRTDYDIVHVQGVHTLVCPLALRAAQRRDLPTVLTFHTGGHSSRARNAVRAAQWTVLGPTLRKTGRLVGVSMFEIELLARRIGIPTEEIRLIPNGAEKLPVTGESTIDMSGDPLIVSVGRLERYKGHHRLIAAMPHVLQVARNAHLVIVGSGPYEAGLRAAVRRQGLEDAVTIVAFGGDERASLGALLAASDVVALMSSYEAQPVALLEAVASGAKLLVADNSGLMELAEQGLATAIPRSEKPPQLARALVAVAAERTDSPRADLPSWDDCADQLMAVYQELLPCRS